MLRAAAEFVGGDEAEARRHFAQAAELNPAWSQANFTQVMSEVAQHKQHATAGDLRAALDRAIDGKGLTPPSH
jgi:hypothetical protein